jgi:hypothetical protein
MGEGPLASALNDRAVGQRIAERHAELDYIRAGVNRSDGDFARRIKRRISRG